MIYNCVDSILLILYVFLSYRRNIFPLNQYPVGNNFSLGYFENPEGYLKLF